jgi:hypothetical protein
VILASDGERAGARERSSIHSGGEHQAKRHRSEHCEQEGNSTMNFHGQRSKL